MIKSDMFLSGEWIKGHDFIDNTTRYTLFVPGLIEGDGAYCDSRTSPIRWCCVVYTEKIHDKWGGPSKQAYFFAADDCSRESSIRGGPYKNVKDARKGAESAIKKLMEDDGVV